MRNTQTFAKQIKSALPTILSCAGVIGLAATTIVAVKATPKAVKLIAEKENETRKTLTKSEKVKAVWKLYIPSALIGISTATCIIGSNVLNKRCQASLAGAYTIISNAYTKYKSKVKELYGEEGHEKILASIAAEKSHAKPIYAGSYIASACLDFGENEEEMLFYDSFSDRYFTSTMGKVLQAEYHLNRNYVIAGGVDINDFYDFLGIPHIENGDSIGWCCCDGDIMWIDFDHKKVVLDDGLEAHIIDIIFEPFELYSDEILSKTGSGL